jgi:hypothetical protein
MSVLTFSIVTDYANPTFRKQTEDERRVLSKRLICVISDDAGCLRSSGILDSVDWYLPTFRDTLSAPSLRVLDS